MQSNCTSCERNNNPTTMAQYVKLKCIIKKGGFRNERIFQMHTGTERMRGICSSEFIFNDDMSQHTVALESGQEASGYVLARIIKEHSCTYTLSLPSGDVIDVHKTLAHYHHKPMMCHHCIQMMLRKLFPAKIIESWVDECECSTCGIELLKGCNWFASKKSPDYKICDLCAINEFGEIDGRSSAS